MIEIQTNMPRLNRSNVFKGDLLTYKCYSHTSTILPCLYVYVLFVHFYDLDLLIRIRDIYTLLRSCLVYTYTCYLCTSTILTCLYVYVIFTHFYDLAVFIRISAIYTLLRSCLLSTYKCYLHTSTILTCITVTVKVQQILWTRTKTLRGEAWADMSTVTWVYHML